MQYHSALVDENYLVIGAHLEKGLIEKIINNEYIDFARLLPKDRATLCDEDHHVEIVNRGGYTYFVPVVDHECSSITSFFKWKQAFRIFSKVYTSRYPNKSAELIQYSHIIFTASQTFIWENVYLYEKELRLHISNYPQHSWSVILQQAWSMYLKDHIKYDYNGSNNKTGNQNQKAKRENCRRFNVGKCTAGKSCRYDHRCDECGKWGHGAHICRKKQNTNNANQNQTANNGSGNVAMMSTATR